jgi:hypothetical protein
MRVPSRFLAWFIPALGLIAGGCVTSLHCPTAPTRPRAPTIAHVVFAELADPADADQLIADCFRLLRPIPSVASFSCGRHVDTERPSVLHDYHVGLVIGFHSPADYAAYVDHPDHVALVEAWKPRLVRLRVYDFLDQPP